MKNVKVGMVDHPIIENHEDLKIDSKNYYFFGTKVDEDLDKGHGTHVLGIIGASPNNGIGVTGTAPNVELCPYGATVLDNTNIKNAIYNQIYKGCKVINISLGINQLDQDKDTLLSDSIKDSEEILNKSKDNDFLIVQSAGNDNKDSIENGFFCSVKDPELRKKVIVVGAAANLNINGKHTGYAKAGFSNYGSYVDVVAPGTDILSCGYTKDNKKSLEGCRYIKDKGLPSNDCYTVMSGTSMAAPFVTGIAAMVWGVKPELKAQEVKQIIVNTADIPVNDLDGNYFGSLVNANAAVKYALPTKDNYGIMNGQVKNSLTNDGIEGVNINVIRNDSGAAYFASEVTDQNGNFDISLNPGKYNVSFIKDGYVSMTSSININDNTPSYYPTLSLVSTNTSQKEGTGAGTVSGYISNSFDGAGEKGIEIKFRKGIKYNGDVIAETTTGSDGSYSLNLTEGEYTGEISQNGYVSTYFYVFSVPNRIEDSQNVNVTPVLPADNVTRVELKSTGPFGDVSDIINPPSGVEYTEYVYSSYIFGGGVHIDKESKTLSLSGDQVNIYRGDNLIVTFNVPKNCKGTIWKIFKIRDNLITPINSISCDVNS